MPAWFANSILAVVLVTAGFAIWTLVSQNRLLKESLASNDNGRPPTWEVGERLPEIHLRGLSGETRILSDIVGNGTTIAFLTTTCPFCLDSLPAWSQANEALRKRGAGIVAISLHPLETTLAYVETHRISWPVYVLASADERPKLKVGAVPLTMTVAGNGEIKAVWLGAVKEEDVEAIVKRATAGLLSSLSNFLSHYDRASAAAEVTTMQGDR
jgi:peroxiredoxin